MARRIGLLGVLGVALLAVASAQAEPSAYGKLSGIVVDPAGTPQMGATILVLAEGASGATTLESLTNQHGLFSMERLRPGLYSVRVTLAGFLPTIERHVRISPSLTTLLKIEMDSVFASFDRLRRHPQATTDSDDWKWVLRTSAATRPVLQWQDGEVTTAADARSEGPRQRQARGRVELTSGSTHRGSISNLSDAAATGFSYDQHMGGTGRLLLAGQMSYERSAAAGIATVWMPSGEDGDGPQTTLVMRQAKLGPEGQTFRGLRLQHASQMALGERFEVHYGAEYILMGLGSSVSSVRPRVSLNARVSSNWTASLLMAALPPNVAEDLQTGALQSALGELDAFPALLWRNGHPVLEGGWHEELRVERKLGAHDTLQAAAFHDRARHVAVFGRGGVSSADFLRDPFSDGFLYDGGAANSWGTRLVYQHKFSDELEVAAVYAWAGALALDDVAASLALRDAFEMRYRHSLATRVATKMPKLGTRVAASYKWVNGDVVSRQDPFGEAAFLLDPNFNLSIRQPLPSFGFTGTGRWEAMADFRNMLAQGYVRVSSADGRVVLVPAMRSFRGGLSFQF